MKDCIVSLGVGKWYPEGIQRMADSLDLVGWRKGRLLRTKLPEGCPDPYSGDEVRCAFKLFATYEAIMMGYRKILWCDSSCWFVRHPNPIFDVIAERGLYTHTSGQPNLSIWTADCALGPLQATREELRQAPSIEACVVGFDLDHPNGASFWKLWNYYYARGAFVGPRWEEKKFPDKPQSGHCSDLEEVKGHRSDQTVASLVGHRLGVEPLSNTECHVFRGMPDECRPHTVICARGGIREEDLKGVPLASS